MKKNIINYINILHGYTTAIKNLHWSSSTMSEHKLCDDIANAIATYEDEIAEIAQGIFGQIDKNELKPVTYTISTTKEMLGDLLKETESLYGKIDGDEFIGLRSVVENFLGEINKFQYLIKLCLKEDMKTRLNKNSNKKRIQITENELKQIVFGSYSILKEGMDTVQWQHFDNNREYQYDAYVVIDNSDKALVSTFEVEDNPHAENDAIEYARDEAKYNKYGSFSVYGCIGNEYDDDTLVYCTDTEGMSESIIRQVVQESINGILNEGDDFEPHGYKGYHLLGDF